MSLNTASPIVANQKKIFVKLQDRKRVLEKQSSRHTTPPTPVITLWGAWLDATVTMKSVINELDRDDAYSTAILQDKGLK
jgi:hypothetical protein